jgi:hypothetical protein
MDAALYEFCSAVPSLSAAKAIGTGLRNSMNFTEFYQNSMDSVLTEF